MDYRCAIRILREKGIIPLNRDIRYSYNKVRMHSKHETPEHFMSKSMLAFLAMKKGKVVMTEAECRNGRCLDILQINESGDAIGYEIESTKNVKRDVEFVDIFEIKLSNMPKKAREGIKYLEKWLKTYLV